MTSKWDKKPKGFKSQSEYRLTILNAVINYCVYDEDKGAVEALKKRFQLNGNLTPREIYELDYLVKKNSFISLPSETALHASADDNVVH